MDEIINVVRLEKENLYSPAYQELVSSLFVQGKVDERIQYAKWLFEDNPALKSDANLPIYICKVNNNDAAQLAIIPVEVVFSGKLIRGGWCVDFYVKSNFQRRGIGKKLLDAAYKDFPLLMTLGQTNASFDLFFSKLGWYYNNNRLIYYKTFLSSSLLIKFLAKKIGLFKKHFLAKKIETQFLSKLANLPIREFTSFQEAINQNLLEIKDSTYIYKDIKYLEWRYIYHPFIRYNKHCIEVLKQYNIYIVWRIVFDGFWQCAKIVEIFYKENTPMSAMKTALHIFMQYVFSFGAEIMECQTNDSFVLQCLPKNIFSSRNIDKRFLYGMASMKDCPFIPNENWKLYSGDCDVETLSF